MGTKRARTLALGVLQVLVGSDKTANIATARAAVREAVAGGARLVVLPECWNSPYAVDEFRNYAELAPSVGETLEDEPNVSPSVAALREWAKTESIFLIGGSIPEIDGEFVYNTSLVFDPSGTVVAKHRKMHLFDIDIPGGITFKESDTLTAGSDVTTFSMPEATIGVGICYDMRFPQLASAMRSRGCDILIYPGAFNTTTGPKHWEPLQVARALDNQCFVATASPARNPLSKYQAWGHSTVVSAWGEVLQTTGHDPDVLVQECDLSTVDAVRAQIPISKQKRLDVYADVAEINK